MGHFDVYHVIFVHYMEEIPVQRFYCIEVSPDKKIHSIYETPDERFHCLELSPDHRFHYSQM